MKQLLEDDIVPDVYQKKCGFVTAKPLSWAKAFEKLLENESDSVARWFYKQEHGLYDECQIDIYFEKTKRVNVEILITTGSVMLHGSHYKEWVNLYFGKLKNIVNVKLEPHESNNLFTVDNRPPTQTERGKDTINEMEKLWDECNTLKAGLHTLERSVLSWEKSNKDMLYILDKHEEIFHETCKKLTVDFDKKLEGFLIAASTDCQQRKNDINSEKSKEVLQQSQNYSRIESRLDKLIKELEQPQRLDSESQDDHVNKLKWTEIETFKKNYNETQQSILNEVESLKLSCSSLETKIEPIGHLVMRVNLTDSNVDTLLSKQKKAELDMQLIQHNLAVMKQELECFNNSRSNNPINTNTATPTALHIPAVSQAPMLPSLSNFQAPTPPALQFSTERHPDERHAFNEIKSNQHRPPNNNNRPLDADRTTKLMICIDSNRKHLDEKFFWKTHGTKWIPCGEIERVNKVFDENKYLNLEVVMINCGVNDIDGKDGTAVANEILATTARIKQEYPNVKIVLSEVTPRKETRDDEVFKCNEVLSQQTDGSSFIHLVKHGNLRNPSWSMHEDDKHIKSTKIAKFAANLKIGLRAAYGITPRPRRVINHRENSQYPNNDSRTFSSLDSRLRRNAGYPEGNEANMKKSLLEGIANYIWDFR